MDAPPGSGAASSGVGETGAASAPPHRTSAAGLEAHIAGTTLLSGEGPAWTDLFVQLFSRHRRQETILVPAVAEPLIVWVVSGEALVEEREPGGSWSASRVTVGDVFLTHSPTPYEMRWRALSDQPFQVMHLYLSLALVHRAAQAVFGREAPILLRDLSGARDDALSGLLALLHGELKQEGAASADFVGGLAQSLAIHIVRTYATQAQVPQRQGALPGFRLRRALASMDATLAEPFDLARTAEAVGMSVFHFSRSFKKATGLSPSQHFIRQRIARARQLLLETDISIIEIGMSVGYSSPSHFAQVFRRETGLSPSQYRRG